MPHKTPEYLVFFDGVCNLCNGFVDFVIQNDTDRKFGFSPLQGELAKTKFTEEERKILESVKVVTPQKHLSKSDAVLFVLSHLSWPYQILALFFRLVPRWIRDRIYDWVARHRLGWFGKRETCRLPTPEEKTYLFP